MSTTNVTLSHLGARHWLKADKRGSECLTSFLEHRRTYSINPDAPRQGRHRGPDETLNPCVRRGSNQAPRDRVLGQDACRHGNRATVIEVREAIGHGIELSKHLALIPAWKSSAVASSMETNGADPMVVTTASTLPTLLNISVIEAGSSRSTDTSVLRPTVITSSPSSSNAAAALELIVPVPPMMSTRMASSSRRRSLRTSIGAAGTGLSYCHTGPHGRFGNGMDVHADAEEILSNR